MKALAAILSGLAGGLDTFGQYYGKMTMAKQLAQIEDEILKKRQAENDARDVENYKKKLEMQAGVGMGPEYLEAIKLITAARRKPSGGGEGAGGGYSLAPTADAAPQGGGSWLSKLFGG